MVFPVLCLDLVGSYRAELGAAVCASSLVPLATEVAVVIWLLWLLLQGSKVTSVPITEAVAEVLAPGVKRKLLGKPGLQPHPSLHSSWSMLPN